MHVDRWCWKQWEMKFMLLWLFQPHTMSFKAQVLFRQANKPYCGQAVSRQIPTWNTAQRVTFQWQGRLLVVPVCHKSYPGREWFIKPGLNYKWLWIVAEIPNSHCSDRLLQLLCSELAQKLLLPHKQHLTGETSPIFTLPYWLSVWMHFSCAKLQLLGQGEKLQQYHNVWTDSLLLPPCSTAASEQAKHLVSYLPEKVLLF